MNKPKPWTLSEIRSLDVHERTTATVEALAQAQRELGAAREALRLARSLYDTLDAWTRGNGTTADSDDLWGFICEDAAKLDRELRKLSTPAPKTETPAKARPPTACVVCHTPIAKFIPEGMEWHPCAKCGGVKCEKCCERGVP